MSARSHRILGMATVMAGLLAGLLPPAAAETIPSKGLFDDRIRTVEYFDEDVIRITGYVGYQIHFQFAPGEEFVNLGTGDRDGIDVGREANHLFIKPRVEKVGTNITLLTNRRAYHLHYTALRKRPDPRHDDVIYSVRFTYREEESRAAELQRQRIEAEARARVAAEAELQARRLQERALAEAPKIRPRNEDYEFCGAPTLKPSAVWDDGVHTRLTFPARAELPAIFVKNDDGSESLVNLNMERDEVVLHRIARQWMLRRGQLVGCVRNVAFEGSGMRLESGTVHPNVQREVRRPIEPGGLDAPGTIRVPAAR